jgi:hypothetical protein
MKIASRAAIFLFTGSLLVGTAAARDIKTGFVTGQFTIKDSGPLANGQAFFFNDATGPAPSEAKYWRVPDHVVALDGNGRFSVELPAGKYYIGVIRRAAGRQHIGPPEDGDLFLGTQGVEGKQIPAYVVKIGEKTDVGILSGATPFRRTAVQYGPGITAIEGIVLYSDGRPAEGALIFGYLSPTMVGKPTYVSERTGKDGTYILRVNTGGRYYLKVRDIYGGGPPAAGAIMGAYGQEKPTEVVVKTGERTSGITIKVIRFPGRGPGGAAGKGAPASQQVK